MTETEKSETHDNGFPAYYDTIFDNSKVHKSGIFDSENPSYFAANIYYNNLAGKNVGVRYKGNSKLRANSGKLPLRFNFDQFEDINPDILDQRFYGFKEISMS